MNILFICDEYPPGKNGGIGTMVQVLGREMIKQGHHVVVIGLYPHYYGQEDYEVDHGVEVHRLRYGFKFSKNIELKLNRLQNKFPKIIQKWLYGESSFKKLTSQIDKLIIEKNIDIIEIQDWNTFNIFNGFTPRWKAFDVPFVVKANGSYTYFCDELNQKANSRLKEIDELLYQRADAVTAVSHYTAGKVSKLFNIKSKVHVLYNSVEVPKPLKAVEREEEMVVFTGSLIAKKGIFSLIKAWNLVCNEKPNAQLYVFGKGDTDVLIELLNPEHIKNVHFMGHTSREIIYDFLSKATLAIFPSYSETFGFCAAEAMSVGCPTIYTKRSCGPEILKENIEGLLVDPDDIEEIASKILKLMEDKDIQKQFSLKGYNAVRERFNIEQSVKDHLDVYHEIIKNFKKQ